MTLKEKAFENILGKGENAGNQHFFLFPQCFLPICNTKKKYLVKPFTTLSRLSMTLKEEAFENIFGKGENVGNQHFLLFPKCFVPFQKQVSILDSHLLCCLGCQKIRPQEDSAQRRPAIFEKIRPRRREDSAPRLRRFGPPYAIVFLSVYFCNMFISFK